MIPSFDNDKYEKEKIILFSEKDFERAKERRNNEKEKVSLGVTYLKISI